MERPLSETQEQQAQQLAAAIAAGAEEGSLRIARALVGSDDATLFGATDILRRRHTEKGCGRRAVFAWQNTCDRVRR